MEISFPPPTLADDDADAATIAAAACTIAAAADDDDDFPVAFVAIVAIVGAADRSLSCNDAKDKSAVDGGGGGTCP